MRTLVILSVVLLAALTGKAVHAEYVSGSKDQPRHWSIQFDNDLIGLGANDRDYTAGIRISTWQNQESSWQGGLLLFTPENLTVETPQANDRPYANLLYVAQTRDRFAFDGSSLTRRTLAIGLLGSAIGEAVQRQVHRAIGADQPEGFDNQISDGGEITGRLGWTRYQPLNEGRRLSIVAETGFSVGYLTEASLGLSFRHSRNPHWWADGIDDFQTHLDEPVRGNSARRSWFGGIRLRGRAYNVLLQGQFRDSDVTFDSDQLNPLVAEAWIGVSRPLRKWQLNYSLRFQSAELRSQYGGRAQVYGSLAVSPRR